MAKTIITMGDPAGIGPEIILKSINALESNLNDICIIGNREIFSIAEAQTLLSLPEDICFIDIDCDISQIQTGMSSAASGELSFLCIEKACALVNENKAKNIVTAPISKHAINLAGHNFSGHTEILEKLLKKDTKGTKNKAEMLFVADNFKVLLLTRHIPLCDVPKNLTQETIIESITILNNALKENFNLKNPSIAICGLNPHAGEQGLIGQEETNIIEPAIKSMIENGINIEGQFPADTLFVKAAKAYMENTKLPYDCYVSCYHDQGLIPVKMLAINKAVNVTIGLSALRTSPAHGTAFDIAGKNIADYESFLEALKLALKL